MQPCPNASSGLISQVYLRAIRVVGQDPLVGEVLASISTHRTTRHFVDHLVLGALSDELTVGTVVFEEESSGLLRDVAG